MDPRTPVLVGAGQLTVRERDSYEPLTLMAECAWAAANDAGDAGLLRRLDAICAIDSLSWPVPDPASALAAQLGASPSLRLRSGLGGNSPQTAVNVLAGRIAAGELDWALVAGAEAMDTLMPYVRRGEQPGWRTQADGTPEARKLAGDRPGNSEPELAAGLMAPVMTYPLIETALRARHGRGVDEHRDRIAALWAGFAAVAAGNEHAWVRDAPDAVRIATPSADNRLVSHPYTKLMNANIQVDQGAALLLCSAAAAQAAGIPRDRWVFLWAGADATDVWFLTERAELDRSPALRACAAAALARAGTTIDDVAHLDLYSCFPSAVQVAALELGLGLDSDRPLTVTGGLTFAGGPGNSYVTHSLAAMASRLRADAGALGLVSALGWYLTKHAVGVYSTAPPPRLYATAVPPIEHTHRSVTSPPAGTTAAIEAYTALYERDGSPGIGIVSALIDDGARVLAKSHDAATLSDLLGGDALGRPVELRDGAQFVL